MNTAPKTMATLSAIPISRPNPATCASSPLRPLQFQFPRIRFQSQFKGSAVSCLSSVAAFGAHVKLRPTRVRAVAEEEAPPDVVSDQSVSVAVSPSDVLTMFFQAEGTMTDSAVPAVTKALEGVEGVSDLKVQVLEGIGSVELTKQTTVQATGVASSLVEAIQGSGFKLQTLNLSFKDEEDFT